MPSKKALILFAHGARDPRWAQPFLRLQQMTQDSRPEVRVELAFLEFMTPALPELVGQLLADACETVVVAPIFLGQGGHVLRDLPLMVEQLRAANPGLEIQLAEAAGEDESVLRAISDYCLKVA